MPIRAPVWYTVFPLMVGELKSLSPNGGGESPNGRGESFPYPYYIYKICVDPYPPRDSDVSPYGGGTAVPIT